MSKDVTGFRGSQLIAWTGKPPYDPSQTRLPVLVEIGTVAESGVFGLATHEATALEIGKIAARMPVPDTAATDDPSARLPQVTRALELAEVWPAGIERIAFGLDTATAQMGSSAAPDTFAPFVEARWAMAGIDQAQQLSAHTPDGQQSMGTDPAAASALPAPMATPGTIQGFFFVDGDGDGVRDATSIDPAVVNRTVELRLDGTLIGTTTTNANGLYRFQDLAPDDGYQVRFYHVDGDIFIPTSGQTVGSGGNLNTANLAVAAGETISNVNAMLVAPPVLEAPQGTPFYQAVETSDGHRFKFQIEDAGTDPAGKWSYVAAPDADNNQTGFQGSGYYVYGTPNPPLFRNGVIDEEILTYTIYVPEGAEGIYNFRTRVSRDGKAESDKENDLWLNFGKVGEAAGIEGYLSGLDGSHPEPTSKGYVKVFGGPNNGSWGHANALDGAPSNKPVKLDITEAGFYQVLIAGRSEGFHIDSFELYTGSAPGNGVNDSPIASIGGPTAADDSFSVTADGRAVKLDVLANDSDVETARADLRLVAVSDADNGSVTIVRSKIFYKPDKGARGSDSFTYTVEDADGNRGVATVDIDIDTTGVRIGGLETGTVSITQAKAGAWVSVRFAESIENAVVVVGPASSNSNAPVIAAVRNVTDKGFHIQLDEWDYDNGTHQLETLSWMAASAGSHKLADGTLVQAGTVTTENQRTVTASFEDSFAATPLVFTQVTTDNDPGAVTTRVRDVGSDSFRVRLQEEEAADALHATEEISWIAVENGASLAFRDAGTLTADDSWAKVRSGDPSASEVFLADMQTFNGADTAALRYQERPNGYLVTVQEERSRDDELGHATETVGYLVGDSGAFDLYG